MLYSCETGAAGMPSSHLSLVGKDTAALGAVSSSALFYLVRVALAVSLISVYEVL